MDNNGDRSSVDYEKYKAKKNQYLLFGIVLGMLLVIVGNSLMNSNVGALTGLFLLSGIVLCCWGCHFYAKSKGYRGPWFLLGLGAIGPAILWLVPLIIVCLPDKLKDNGQLPPNC